MTTITKLIAAFAPIMAAWPREAGPKVTEAQLRDAAKLVKRTGTGKHLGMAMMLRNGGATQPQIVLVTGDTQVNVGREAVAAKLAKPVNTPKADGGHKVYKFTLAGKAAKAAKAETAPKADEPATPASPAEGDANNNAAAN